MGATRAGRGVCEGFVLGTIHQFHAIKAGYTLSHLEVLLEAFAPDILAVEIRPEDWEKGDLGRGPFEMGHVAIPWTKKKGVPIAPVDSWEDGMPDEHRRALA